MNYRAIAIITLCLVSSARQGSSGPFAATSLKLVPVASGFSHPLYLTSPPADSTRLFVVEKEGVIRIIKNGSVVATPFLNCSTLVKSDGTEQGLLGLAFHPNYKNNRYFYVNYTRQTDGATVISRFRTSATNPDLAPLASESTLLIIAQPYPNHNGGMLAFGPDDGYLYLGLGDGGSAGDPGDRAQDSTTLLGKILRIDVDMHTGTLIPPTNPFVRRFGWRKEIWAYGLRNPWRFSFDRGSGKLYIADVGQSQWEEIDIQSALSPGGQNYGWRRKEGNHCYNPPADCEAGFQLVDPIYEYDHTTGCSITGGYVYRGCAIPDLQGTYFFGDFCTGDVWSFTYSGTVKNFQTRTAELGTEGIQITSFGEDAQGELYITEFAGTVYKIEPNGPAGDCSVGSCCVGTTGNVDGSGIVDIVDLDALVSYLVGLSTQPLPCADEANINRKGIIDLSDLSILMAYLTGSPVLLPGCF